MTTRPGRQGRYTCGQVKGITVHHLDDIRGKTSDLQKIERVLREMAAQREGGRVPKCPVIDPLFDEASARIFVLGGESIGP